MTELEAIEAHRKMVNEAWDEMNRLRQEWDDKANLHAEEAGHYGNLRLLTKPPHSLSHRKAVETMERVWRLQDEALDAFEAYQEARRRFRRLASRPEELTPAEPSVPRRERDPASTRPR